MVNSTDLVSNVEQLKTKCPFLGMESAAYCAPKVGRVTVLGRTDVPFLDSLGREFGQRIVELFETHGVHIRNNVYAVKFEGSDNKLTGVVLNTGETIPAEICIVGIGSEYDTKFLSETDIKLTKQGAIEVNEVIFVVNIPLLVCFRGIDNFLFSF